MTAEPALVFRVHAVQQMFRRGISEVDVRDVVANGTVIERYPDDLPFPAEVRLGWVGAGPGATPLHIVTSFDATSNTLFVVTVYQPDPRLWEDGFRRRRKP
ncbi:MAG: DUF4258 domain-containing protein [Planctomycetota bacterium]|nr:DUF4258 domain-containing protein [Planctomycetota bacterium]